MAGAQDRSTKRTRRGAVLPRSVVRDQRTKGRSETGGLFVYWRVRLLIIRAVFDTSILDPMAACFAEAIWREFPEWDPLLELVEMHEVRISVLEPGGERRLEVVAGDSKISLSYGDFGYVIGTFLCGTEEATVADAMETICGIVTEELRTDITYRDGVKTLASLGKAFFSIKVTPGEEVRAYSWRGTHNAIVRG